MISVCFLAIVGTVLELDVAVFVVVVVEVVPVDAIWLEVIPAVVVGVEVVASAAVSTHFWTISVRTGVVVDTVGLAFDVVLPTAVLLFGGSICSRIKVGVDVDVMLDCCDAIIQWWG